MSSCFSPFPCIKKKLNLERDNQDNNTFHCFFPLLIHRNCITLHYPPPPPPNNTQMYIWVSQKFCNILITWSTIWQLWMLLSGSWSWRTTLDCEMLSSSDNFQILLVGIASMAWRLTSESRSTWPCLIIKVLSAWEKFLEPFSYNTVINCTFTFHSTNNFGCVCCVMAQFKLIKHKFPK